MGWVTLNLLWQIVNSWNVSYVIMSQWKFAWYQILLFHFPSCQCYPPIFHLQSEHQLNWGFRFSHQTNIIIVFIYSPAWQKSRIDQGPHNFFHVPYRPFHLTLKLHIFWGFHNHLYVFTGKPMVVTFISKWHIKTRIFVILKLRANQKDCFS